MQEKWTEITRILEKKLDPGMFKIWIAPLSGYVQDDVIYVNAPNSFMRDWIKKRLEIDIIQAASIIFNKPSSAFSLVCSIKAREENKPVQTSSLIEQTLSSVKKRQQINLPISASPLPAQNIWRFCFEDFITGSSNKLAAAAAQSIIDNDGISTLFINAGSGLGKTHLVQATGQLFSHKERTNCLYLTAEQFASRYVAAMRTKDLESFKIFLCGLDLLILEDVHFLQKKRAMQEMILGIIKNLQEKGAKIIFTSSFAPKQLPDIDSQLISHFCSGILTSMEKPTMEMRKEILFKKAENYKINLPEEICTVLSQRLSSDVRQLESCLKNMVFKARLLNSGLTLDMALETVNQFASSEPVNDINYILNLVYESFGLSHQQLSSKSRKKEYTACRNTAFYLARKHTDLSLEEIGCIFNRRHSTVLRGITQVEQEMARESSTGRQFARAVQLIEKKCGF